MTMVSVFFLHGPTLFYFYISTMRKIPNVEVCKIWFTFKYNCIPKWEYGGKHKESQYGGISYSVHIGLVTTTAFPERERFLKRMLWERFRHVLFKCIEFLGKAGSSQDLSIPETYLSFAALFVNTSEHINPYHYHCQPPPHHHQNSSSNCEKGSKTESVLLFSCREFFHGNWKSFPFWTRES